MGIAVVGLIWSIWSSPRATDYVAYERTYLTVQGNVQESRVLSLDGTKQYAGALPKEKTAPANAGKGTAGGGTAALPVVDDGTPPPILTNVPIMVRPGNYTLELDGVQNSLTVISKYRGYAVAVAVLALFFGLPMIMFGHTQLGRHLLSEPGGGYSLGRVQFLIWFLPALVIYVVLSVPLLRFAPVPNTLWILLGLSTATSAISAAVSGKPSASKKTLSQQAADFGNSLKASLQKAAASGGATAQDAQQMSASVDAFVKSVQESSVAQMEAAPPDDTPPAYSLRDTVEDWTGNGDASRYQYLILCVVGAVTLVVTFLKSWTVPDLPEQFLYLVMTSQAAYVGVKAVKKVG